MGSQQAAPKRRTTIQVSLSEEDKRLLKRHAAERGTTVAAIVHEWVSKFCTGKG